MARKPIPRLIIWLNAALLVVTATIVIYLGACRNRAQPAPPITTSADRAFVADPEHFTPKGKAKPGEWLAQFHEPGQNFQQYLIDQPVRRTAKRNQIVLQPIGVFTAKEHAILEKMREFAAIFFDCPVRIAPPVGLPQHATRERGVGLKKWTQVHAGTILTDVLASRLPDDAICYLGITMTDLYPEESWNFVFGQANLRRRVGVYSLHRYFPEFNGLPDSPAAQRLALQRGFSVLSHETGHMFSIKHCIFYECLMNGSNSLAETDRQPGHLCTVCLRKLHWNLQFDVRKRYSRLRALYKREGLTELEAWMDSRLKQITPASQTAP